MKMNVGKRIGRHPQIILDILGDPQWSFVFNPKEFPSVVGKFFSIFFSSLGSPRSHPHIEVPLVGSPQHQSYYMPLH